MLKIGPTQRYIHFVLPSTTNTCKKLNFRPLRNILCLLLECKEQTILKPIRPNFLYSIQIYDTNF